MLTTGHIDLNWASKIEELRNRNPGELLVAANQHLPVWLSLALTVAIAWYLAKLFWVLIPSDPALAIPVAPARSPQTSSSAAPDYSHQDIVKAHVFGQSNADDTPAPADTSNAPETRLNLLLMGTIVASDEKTAHAIITEKGKSAEVYFLGDAVPGGASLHQVMTDRVILNRGGVLETLRLPDVVSMAAPSAPVQAKSSRRRNFGPRSTRQAVDEDGQTGPVSFTSIVRPQPYMPNGELKGYRLYPGRDRKRFAALGLRPGDLVTDINGMALNNITDGMEVFKSMADATSVTITLERNGQVQVLNLDTSQLNLTDEKR